MYIRYSTVAIFVTTFCVSLLLGIISTPTFGQISLDCPAKTSVFPTQGTSINLWSDFAKNPESVVELSITAEGEAIASADFILMLDLDGDGEQETRVDSRNLSAPGTIPFNNENSFDEPRSFGPAGSSYAFAVQTTQEGNLTACRIAFVSENGTVLPMVLPVGKHAIVWTLTTKSGEVESCFRSFIVKSDQKPTQVPAQVSILRSFPEGLK